MGYIIPSYSNLVRYTLRDSLGILEISEPLNWKEDEKEFKRSTKVHGVFINLSNNLQFPRGDERNNGGYDRLRRIYDLDGINAQVLLVKEEDIDGEGVGFKDDETEGDGKATGVVELQPNIKERENNRNIFFMFFIL